MIADAGEDHIPGISFCVLLFNPIQFRSGNISVKKYYGYFSPTRSTLYCKWISYKKFLKIQTQNFTSKNEKLSYQ